MNPLVFWRYGVAFISGVFVMWLWHNASINRIEKNEAKEETKQVEQVAQTAINDGIQAGANTNEYLQKFNKANAENTALRGKLNDGSVRLRICQAESKTIAVQNANTSAALNQASADIARYTEDALYLEKRGKEVDAWIDSAHSWINR